MAAKNVALRIFSAAAGARPCPFQRIAAAFAAAFAAELGGSGIPFSAGACPPEVRAPPLDAFPVNVGIQPAAKFFCRR